MSELKLRTPKKRRMEIQRLKPDPIFKAYVAAKVTAHKELHIATHRIWNLRAPQRRLPNRNGFELGDCAIPRRREEKHLTRTNIGKTGAF